MVHHDGRNQHQQLNVLRGCHGRIAPTVEGVLQVQAQRGSTSPIEAAQNSFNLETAENAEREQKNWDSYSLECLKSWFGMLYFSGLSTYKNHAVKPTGKNKMFLTWEHRTQKVIFWTVATFSVFYSLCYMKTCMVHFLSYKQLTAFVDFGYFLATAIIKVYWVMIVTKYEGTIDGLLSELEKSSGTPSMRSKLIPWVVIAGIATIFSALVKVFMGGGISNWSFDEMLEKKAGIISSAIFDWHVLQNTSEMTEGSPNSTSNVPTAVIAVVSDVCSSLQIGAVKDSLLILAIILYNDMDEFARQIKKLANLGIHELHDQHESIDTHWEKYRKLRNMSVKINVAFGRLLKILHVVNELSCAYTMSYVLEEDISTISILVMLFGVGKTFAAYLLAAETHKKNILCENWIKNSSFSSSKVRINGMEYDSKYLLWELKREPIGLGEDNFIVDEVFVLKFYCFAVSILLFLVSAEQIE